MIGRTSDRIGLSAALSGPADPALRFLAETQAAITKKRTGNHQIADAICGYALEGEAPAPVRIDFARDIFAKIDAYEGNVAHSKAAAKAAGASLQELLDLPQPLRDLALETAGERGWTFAGPGVKTMKLGVGGRNVTKLLRIEPGHGAPNHDHTGTEYTLVVSGAFDDGVGHFGPGDISINRPGQIHHPIATHDGVCFAVSVEEGAVAFTGALGVLQRLFTRH